jgi:PKD repeat protein
MSRVSYVILLVVAAASVTLASAADEARAVVVDAAPVWPIPSDAPPSPPPIPTLPAAAEAAPPADEIADPVTQAATCGDWYLQSSYGDRWPAGSSWWEYRCTYEHYEYYPHPCPGTGACDAVCYGYPFDCYSITQQYADYFYWDGSRAVFYGETYAYSIDEGYSGSSLWWWDGPKATWYALVPPAPPAVPPTASFTVSCTGLSCSFDGSGSAPGSAPIGSYSWNFGDGASATGATVSHVYAAAGTFGVTLTVTDTGGGSGAATRSITVTQPRPPTPSFVFSCTGLTCSFDGTGSTAGDAAIATYRWSFGDGTTGSGVNASHTFAHAASYAASLTLTDVGGGSATTVKDVVVTNLAPTAGFTVSCAGLRCTVDAGASSDRDGALVSYSWSFGDGSVGTGRTSVHDYSKAGAYTVALTVTDNDGASASSSQRINPISLSARAYKEGGQQKADLAWNGVAETSFDVYRDGAKVATVQATAYTDVVPKSVRSRTYRVCTTGGATCSTDVTVMF